MGVELLRHVQLAMPAGGERLARGCYAGLLGRRSPSPQRPRRAAGRECRDDDEFKDYKRMFIFDPRGKRLELLQPRAASR